MYHVWLGPKYTSSNIATFTFYWKFIYIFIFGKDLRFEEKWGFEIWLTDLNYFLKDMRLALKIWFEICPSMVLTLGINSGLDIENKSAKTVVEQMQQSYFCCSCLKNQFWAQRDTCSSAQHSMNTICGKTTKVKNECLQYWQRKVTSLLPLTE